MKQVTQSITKGEVKFWIGIIVLIGSMIGGFWSLKTDVALIKKDVANINELVARIDKNFGGIHEDQVDLTFRVLTLENLSGITEWN